MGKNFRSLILRERSKELSDVSSKLADAVGFFARESLYINEYEAELKMLLQEKSFHLEQLRLVEKDIAAIEQTIFEAKIDKLKTLKLAHKLSNDYSELLAEVNSIRTNLGLLSLTDKRCPEAVALTQPPSTTPLQISASDAPDGPPVSGCLESLPVSSALNQEHISVWLSSLRHGDLSWAKQFATGIGDLSDVSSMECQTRTSTQSLRLSDVMLGSGMNTVPQSSAYSGLPAPPPPPIPPSQPQQQQQQQPPMKTCQACKQLIHRNAPICPLCKTKSRSQHPKRPKTRGALAQPVTTVITSAPPVTPTGVQGSTPPSTSAIEHA
ncbi:Zinc finger C4H2 domain-containing protein [Echinococcus granulosus]|uniref:Zinc finger C4H2 domain-containing protein n=1 Tax=Echinococcus granulosus TaxID=6210 RepID=W6UPE1_ECHGR|nr:Zinc finger C4H2 domain-containing protein [Echinococcus granulosus]EUB62646.1 Zinc finger C4H2 domain-containing protein [Echinococcus granulosus]